MPCSHGSRSTDRSERLITKEVHMGQRVNRFDADFDRLIEEVLDLRVKITLGMDESKPHEPGFWR